METPFREQWVSLIHRLQDEICQALEKADGRACFMEETWQRPSGGGGKTRVLSQGAIFEKAGVNTSVVHGPVTDAMRSQLPREGTNWFACGISLVLHPSHPLIPTVHANYRMFELYDDRGTLADRWFGGGTDLTPYYLQEEDIRHFHRTYKAVCDRFDADFYPRFKEACDQYFVNHHRQQERRGVGGIFYDYQRPLEHRDETFWYNFAEACAQALAPAYLPAVAKYRDLPFSEAQKFWQEIRRGRYVEFNLIHDRGTIFGLRTQGRTESILMSLPPRARWEYQYLPKAGSPEAALQEVCLHPRDWT